MSLKTLDLIGLNTPPADGALRVSQLNFHNSTIHSHGVLADVREGGLKRDLSTILEQPIRREDSRPEFMLYAFDDSRFPDRSSSHALYTRQFQQDREVGFSDGRDDPIHVNTLKSEFLC